MKIRAQFYRIFSALALTIALVIPVFVSAAPSAGIKPSSIFYFFDIAAERLNLFFTFNPENKARRALEYADERLAEVEAVASDADAIKTALTNYEGNIDLAAEKTKDIGEKEKVEVLLTTISDSTSKHQEFLIDVLAKVPDEARGAIMKAIEISHKEQEAATLQITELKGEVEKLRQEIAELKVKDEQKERVIEELSKQKSESPVVKPKNLTPQIPNISVQKSEAIQPQLLPKAEAKKTTIVTLPNGAVVEMDINGNILYFIKEAPINISTQVPATSITPLPTPSQNTQSTADQEVGREQDAMNEKRRKLNAINQQIADLNAKYAEDSQEIYQHVGGTLSGQEAAFRRLDTEYNIAYNILKAQYQQILYSN